MLGSSLFAIDDVEVEGAVYTDEERLAAVVDDLDGTPVLRVDTDARRARRSRRSRGSRTPGCTTDFPHGAKIEIRERTPVATFEGADGRCRVIDADGRVLDVLDGQPVDYLLGARAPTRRRARPGQFAPPGFGAAASLVQALTPRAAGRRRSRSSVTPDGSDLRLLLDDGIEVRFGAGTGPRRPSSCACRRGSTSSTAAASRYVDVSTNEVDDAGDAPCLACPDVRG